jgi:hypothetical protein
MSIPEDAPRQPTEGWTDWQPGSPEARYVEASKAVFEASDKAQAIAERDAALAELKSARQAIAALHKLLGQVLAITDDIPPKGGTPVDVKPRGQTAPPPPWGDDTRGMGE